MNAILIELSDKTVFVAKLEPQTASEDPLTDKDKVILDLHRRLEALQQANEAKTSTERQLNMPDTTLVKAVNGSQKLPKKWIEPLSEFLNNLKNCKRASQK